MMLEWAAEQPTEITTTAIDLEFLPTDTNEDRGVQKLEFELQQMHTALLALMSCEANDSVANSRIRRQEEGNETFKRVSNAGSPTCLATKFNIDDPTIFNESVRLFLRPSHLLMLAILKISVPTLLVVRSVEGGVCTQVAVFDQNLQVEDLSCVIIS